MQFYSLIGLMKYDAFDILYKYTFLKKVSELKKKFVIFGIIDLLWHFLGWNLKNKTC